MVSALVRAGCGSVVGVSLEARIAELEVLISGLGVEVERLQTENTALRVRVEVLEGLEVENTALRAEIVSLKSKGSKNSGNSSMPPSRDPAGERQRQATERQAKKRRAAGGTSRRAGGQPGSPGTTRSMTDTPDVTIDHVSQCCSGCGAGLDDAAVTGVVRRQSIDIPPVTPVVTEHREALGVWCRVWLGQDRLVLVPD